MRTLGLLLLIAGIACFFYCGDQLATVPPLPDGGEGLTVGETLRYPAGRLEAGRYAGVALALFGLILMILPKGNG